MKKQDILIIAALVGLSLVWGVFDSKILAPKYPAKSRTNPEQTTGPGRVDVPAGPVEGVPGPVVGDPDPGVAPLPEETPTPPGLTAAPDEINPLKDLPDEVETLDNERVQVQVSSLGGSIRLARLKNYRAENTEDSAPVELDFGAHRALVLTGLTGLGAQAEYSIEKLSDTRVKMVKTTDYGIRVERIIELGEGYALQVKETFFNDSDQALQLPEFGSQLGLMRNLPGETATRGMNPLGIDTLAQSESKVKHWRNLSKLTKNAGGIYRDVMNKPVDWVAAKNKYFAQSLIPSVGADNFSVYAHWNDEHQRLDQVAASLVFNKAVIEPGRSMVREMTYFVGPKKLSELKALGHRMDGVMELGYWFIPYVAQFLLVLLNAVEGVVRNYGIAIMLVTLVIKILFWPLTHRGTESMRRMQELSPQMKELNEKHKEDPQRKQQELMKFYKENKINPLGGCLPMLIQFPFFIGLFYVLRTAIELRFAGFLWIEDLSEPDRLFTFSRELPFIGDSFNILPIVMAVSMFLQQKIAPTSAATDEKQQQMQQTMMRVMPIMMLVMLYKFASGLALYWATQNFLMIAQQLIYRKRKAMKEAKADS